MKFDIIVLGAGMIGTCVAAHLAQRGLAVALLDRKAPGGETSYGNAGLIEREGVYPYAFPRGVRELMRYARNRATDVRYEPRALPGLLPFLYRYWWNSRPDRHAAIARHYATLIEHCVTEHRALAGAAGVADLLRPDGWVRAFRTPAALNQAIGLAQRWHLEYGIQSRVLDGAALAREEPSLCDGHGLIGGVHFSDPYRTVDPGGLVQGYAQHFVGLGGVVANGDVGALRRVQSNWQVDSDLGILEAPRLVVALGPWSDVLAKRFGATVPLAVKRGYHMHFAPQPGALLNRPLLDAQSGFLLIPMTRGIRMTTGAELAARDAPATPIQLDRLEPVARRLFPLGHRLDPVPWKGARPCTPDMLPVIGPAPRDASVWLAYGHAHHGLTLGPVTGRLLAEMITGSPTLVDPTPFRADRF